MMNSQKTIVSIIGLCLLLSSITRAGDEQLLDVTVKPLSALLIESKQSTPATIVNLNTAIISAEITGRVLKVYPEVGDSVKEKQRCLMLLQG